MKDYYKILGVERNASQEDIQRAFRKLAHQHHPDKRDGDVRKFKEANEAYQVLNDTQKRAQYDAGFGKGGFDGAGFGGFDFSNFDVKFSGGGSNFADIINSMFHGVMNRGEDIQIDLSVSFEESVFGAVKRISVLYRRKGTEMIEVRMPAGISSGARIQFSGRGEPSKDGRAPAGDLYVRVDIRQHEHFERHGGDIVYKLELTPTEALLGVTKELRDVRGDTVSVTVPEMSREGSHIVLQGRGIPQPAGTGRLIVLCHIVYPKRMSGKTRSLLSDLRKEGW